MSKYVITTIRHLLMESWQPSYIEARRLEDAVVRELDTIMVFHVTDDAYLIEAFPFLPASGTLLPSGRRTSTIHRLAAALSKRGLKLTRASADDVARVKRGMPNPWRVAAPEEEGGATTFTYAPHSNELITRRLTNLANHKALYKAVKEG